MNDYQMSSLANDRSKQLLAEAQQHRLARQTRPRTSHREPAQQRGGLRISLDFLLGRNPA